MAFSFTDTLRRGREGSSSINGLISSLVTAITSAFAEKQDVTGNTFTVATLPDATANVGRVVYVSDGDAGSPCAAISDGTNWKVAGTLGATCAAA